MRDCNTLDVVTGNDQTKKKRLKTQCGQVSSLQVGTIGPLVVTPRPI
jgi:hypothetical protein